MSRYRTLAAWRRPLPEPLVGTIAAADDERPDREGNLAPTLRGLLDAQISQLDRCRLCLHSGQKPRKPEYVSTYRWIRFGPDTLLISSRNMAHIPGACDHVTEEYVLDPNNGWGWIPNPDPTIWDRISTSTPAKATEGDTSRAATIRYSSCSATLQS